MGLLEAAGKLAAPVTASARAAYAQVASSPTELDIDDEIRLLEAGSTPTTATGKDEDDEHDGLRDSGYMLGNEDKSQHAAGLSTTYKREAWVLMTYMTPIFFSSIVSRYCTTMGPVSASGKYGPTALAGASLANTTFNVLCAAVIYGFSGALDTLSTQAEGQKNKTCDLNMLYALRVTLVSSCVMLALSPLIYWIEGVFTLLHIEAEAAKAGATFIHWACLGLPGFVGYEMLRKYFSSKGIMVAPAIAGFVAAPLTIPVMRSDMFGSNTPPISLALYFTLSFLAEATWAYFYLPRDTWSNLPSWPLIRSDLGIILKFGAAGVASSCSDWWAWEALAFFAAWLGPDVLAGQGVLLTTATFWFALPAGLMNASSTRVGNHLGSGAAENARLAAITALAMGVTVAAITSGGLTLNAKVWTGFYTDDPNIAGIVTKALPTFAVILAFDAIQGVGGGILRAAGLPIEIARIMLTGHYLVGLPLAFVCGFTAIQGGLTGLWAGFSIGLAIVCGRMAWIIFHLDYEDAARKAQAHISSSEAVAVGGTLG